MARVPRIPLVQRVLLTSRMYPSPLISLLLISLANAHSEPELIRVQHRVVHPSLPITPWAELGTVAIPPLRSISPLGSPAILIPSGTLLDDLVEFKESVDPTMEGAMYQVALDRPGVPDGVWPTSVMKTVSRANIPEPLTSSRKVRLVLPARIDLVASHYSFLPFRPSVCRRSLRVTSSP